MAIHVISADQNVGRFVFRFALGWKDELLFIARAFDNAHDDFHLTPPFLE